MLTAIPADASDAPSKKQILSSALSLFARDGLNATTIRGIADAAGYTNPALYKFFASKEELALYLFERCYAHVYERLSAAAGSAEGFDARLRALIAAWAQLAEAELEVLLFTNESLREFWPRVRPALRRRSLLKLFAELIALGQREHRIRASLAPELGVALIVGCLGQVGRQLFFGALRSSARALEPELIALLSAALTGGA